MSRRNFLLGAAAICSAPAFLSACGDISRVEDIPIEIKNHSAPEGIKEYIYRELRKVPLYLLDGIDGITVEPIKDTAGEYRRFLSATIKLDAKAMTELYQFTPLLMPEHSHTILHEVGHHVHADKISAAVRKDIKDLCDKEIKEFYAASDNPNKWEEWFADYFSYYIQNPAVLRSSAKPEVKKLYPILKDYVFDGREFLTKPRWVDNLTHNILSYRCLCKPLFLGNSALRNAIGIFEILLESGPSDEQIRSLLETLLNLSYSHKAEKEIIEEYFTIAARKFEGDSVLENEFILPFYYGWFLLSKREEGGNQEESFLKAKEKLDFCAQNSTDEYYSKAAKILPENFFNPTLPPY